MKFSDVIGQEEVASRLRALVSNGRLSHALLLLGKEGAGGLPLAIAFAQYILCDAVSQVGNKESATPSLFDEPAARQDSEIKELPDDSCGNCPSCHKISALVHPDLHFSYPVVTRKAGSPPLSSDYAAEWREFVMKYPYGNDFDWLQFIGAENKQGNISAAECDDIHRRLNLKSFESGLKILIIWMPEYLNKEGNKLLKLIEEPPEKTLFLLVAEEDGDILPTIISRTQLVSIPPIQQADMVSALISRCQLDQEKAWPIATLSDGNYREALSLMQNHQNDWLSLAREWFNAILRNGQVAQVKWVEDMAKFGREEQKQFLQYVSHLVEVAIRLSAMGELAPPFPEPEKEFAARLNKIAATHQLEALANELGKAFFQIERNAHGKILFLALSIRIQHIIRNNSLILVN